MTIGKCMRGRITSAIILVILLMPVAIAAPSSVIQINHSSSLDDFDVDKADGFEEETEALIDEPVEELKEEAVFEEVPFEEVAKSQNVLTETEHHEFKNLDIETPKLMQ